VELPSLLALQVTFCSPRKPGLEIGSTGWKAQGYRIWQGNGGSFSIISSHLPSIVDGLGLGIGLFPLLDADLLAGRIIAPLPGTAVTSYNVVVRVTGPARFVSKFPVTR
jgi:hypothetical protein